MVRRSSRELGAWEEYQEEGREFVRAEVPKGANAGRRYAIAKRLAERYEIKGFFASGGLGLILRGRDLHTETDVLVKTTLDYQIVHEAKGRDVEGMQRRIRAARRTLQTERLDERREAVGIVSEGEALGWIRRLAATRSVPSYHSEVGR